MARRFALPISIAIFAVAVVVHAQTVPPAGPQRQPGISRADLLRNDLSASGREVIQVRVDFQPGAVAARHSHPGEEIAYVLRGSLEYRVGNRPPVILRAGDVLFIPDGAVHAAKNVGSESASELATYVVRKGEPLLTPVE